MKETRLIFDVEDIVSIRYTCPQSDCRGEIVRRLDSQKHVGNGCPFCGGEFWPARRWPNGPGDPPERTIFDNLKALTGVADDRCRVRFEMRTGSGNVYHEEKP